MGVRQAYGPCKRFVSGTSLSEFSKNGGNPYADSSSVNFAVDAAGCRRRWAGLRGALLQRRVEPVASLLDRGSGGHRRGRRLGPPAAFAAACRARVLRLAGGLRRLAGSVDRVVDRVEPLLGLREPRARLPRLRGRRRAARRRLGAAADVRRGGA